jgi:hypothetical protein
VDFNALVTSRYAEQVRRWLGEDISLGAVAPEVVPVVVLEHDDIELALLKQERLWQYGQPLAAIAAVAQGFAFVNPAAVGAIVTIKLVRCSTDTVNIAVGQLPIPATYLLFDRVSLTDTRTMRVGQVPLTRGSTQVFYKNTLGPTAGLNIIDQLVAEESIEDIVLGPDGYMIVEQATNNVAVGIWVSGKERAGKAEELRGL